MQASMHLGRLHDAAQHRLQRLRKLQIGIGGLPSSERSIKLAHIAIELDNLNICTFREFMISTIRRAKTLSGRRISVNQSLGPEEEIGAFALSVLNPVKFRNMRNPRIVSKADEPTFRDPKELEKILTACAASNLPSLQNALALNSTLFRDLKCLRHFYAHRCNDTFRKVSRYAATIGILNLSHPDQILTHVITGRPHSILEDWFSDAEIFYSLLMQ